MSREIHRVPLDFAWPIDQIWHGYLNPHYAERQDCPACGGTGSAPDARRFADEWYGKAPFDPAAYGARPLSRGDAAVVAFATRNVDQGGDFYYRFHGAAYRSSAILREVDRLYEHWKGQWCHHLIQADVDALVARGRLMDFTHTPRDEAQRAAVRAKRAAGGNSWMPEPNGHTPTADEVNAWSLSGMGHDSINSWVCVAARCAREGVESTCPACGGEGDRWPSPAAKAAYDAWERTGPPEGPGWQVWETVSEGSPISPVFRSSADMIAWLIGEGYSPAAAEGFARSGWAPSAVAVRRPGEETAWYPDIESAAPGVSGRPGNDS